MTPDKTIYDVVVAGAGPAGSTAAYLMASQGVKVCLVDKQLFPRPKLCAGLLTWKTVDLLNRVFGYTRQQLMQNRIITHKCRNYRIYLGTKAVVHGCLDFPFHFIDRTHYDHFWLQQAQQAGCNIQTGKAVTHVDSNQGKVVLDNGTHLKAGTIIGADGVWSKARLSIAGRKKDRQRWHHQLAATIETVQSNTGVSDDENYAALHFGYLPWGYAWSFPGSAHQILGMGGLPRKGCQSMRLAFSRFLNAVTPPGDQQAQWRSYPLPYGNSLRHPSRGRVILVGDACGLADPLLGEGIYYAHRSAELAAQAVISTNGNAPQASKQYRKALNTHVLKELRWIKLYRNLLFMGGSKRRYRGLRLFFHLMPKRLEAAVHGRISFSKLLIPWHSPPQTPW